MFENHIPIRFGVILYSAKLIEEIESSGGQLPLSYKEDSPNQEELSSLVITQISLELQYWLNKIIWTFISLPFILGISQVAQCSQVNTCFFCMAHGSVH